MRPVLLLLINLAIASSTQAASGTPEIHNVVDFGAVGDGISNDTDAFNAAVETAAIEGGGTVYVPCGTYLIGKDSGPGRNFYSGIRITTDDISIVGEGPCSELWPVNSNGNAIIAICESSTVGSCIAPSEISNIRISRLTFRDPDPESHRGSEESHGVLAKNVKNLRISNNRFIAIGDEAVDIIHGRDVSIVENHFDGCPGLPSSAGSAISISGTHYVTIIGNSIVNAPPSPSNRGIDIAANSEMSTEWINITNNRFSENQFLTEILIASGLADIRYVTIAANLIDHAGLSGFAIKWAGQSFSRVNVRVTNNTIHGPIYLIADQMLIADNTISGSHGSGVGVGGSSVRISGNTISEFPRSCLFVIGGSRTGPLDFEGNSCNQTSSSGERIVSSYKSSEILGPVSIDGNTLIGAPGAMDGVGSVGEEDMTVSGNTIIGGRRGIVGGNLVTGNQIRDVTQYGIFASRDGERVINNQVIGADSRCIFVYSANDVFVSGNYLESCGRYAISSGGTAENSICMGNNARNNPPGDRIVCDEEIANLEP